MAKSKGQQSLPLNDSYPSIDERFQILEDQLKLLQEESKGEDEEIALKAARQKLKKTKELSVADQEMALEDMETQVYSWIKTGEPIEVSQATMADYNLKQSRIQDAKRISFGLGTAAASAAAYGYVNTMSERSGDGIAERRVKQTMSAGSRALSIATTGYFLGPQAAAVAAAGVLISWGVGEYTSQVKLDRQNKDSAYRMGLMGPASYSGSR